jgi:hypothetical protein
MLHTSGGTAGRLNVTYNTGHNVTQGIKAVSPGLTLPCVAGSGHASLLTNSDTWHSERVRDIGRRRILSRHLRRRSPATLVRKTLPSEIDAKLAQKLGQFQPSIVVFPQEHMGQLLFSGPT